MPSSKLPADAGPHPLKAVLHDICRAITREQTDVTADDLAALLAKEDLVSSARFARASDGDEHAPLPLQHEPVLDSYSLQQRSTPRRPLPLRWQLSTR